MNTFGGGHIISWSQTLIEGLRSPPLSALEVGASWSWSGPSTMIDLPGEARRLPGEATVRTRTLHAVKRLLDGTVPPVRPVSGGEYETVTAERDFVVSCGREEYRVVLIELPEIARPLLLFDGGRPPQNRFLRIVRAPFAGAVLRNAAATPAGVICFTPGTLLATPEGPRPVEHLAEGDYLDTKDSGVQEIMWVGRRRMSGARMHAMPDLRPVRFRAGALGRDEALGELVVSPRHKVLIEGPVADALFGTPEVLAAAEDLVDGRRVIRDHALPEVTYIHLMLPRHHIVRANGLESESFHPASTDLRTVDPTERARLEDMIPGLHENPRGYGDAVRRELSSAEAAALRAEGALAH